MAKRKQRPKAEVPEWVVTYGDLMSLLLTFFILLAAFSELKQPREYQKVLDAIKEALGVQGGMGVSQVPESTNNSMVNFFREKAKRDGELRNTLEDVDPSVVGRQEKSAIIQEGALHAIGGSVLFEPGSAELNRAGREMLRNEVAPKIKGLRYICRVIGHSWGMEDRRQGHSHRELGFLRADAVIDFLVRECGVDPSILQAVTFGEHAPMVLAAGPGQDDGVNRRVQIYQSGQTIDQVHPDPNFTGASD